MPVFGCLAPLKPLTDCVWPHSGLPASCVARSHAWRCSHPAQMFSHQAPDLAFAKTANDYEASLAGFCTYCFPPAATYSASPLPSDPDLWPV